MLSVLGRDGMGSSRASLAKLQLLLLLSASAAYFPFSASWAFSGGPSTLHFQDFPRWLLCNPDVVYLFICHSKSNNTKKGIEQVSSPSKKKERDLTVSSICFFEVEKVVTKCCSTPKSIFPCFYNRRLLLREKLGCRNIIPEEVSALWGSAGAVCKLHLGPSLCWWLGQQQLCGRNPWRSLEILCEVALLHVIPPWG